MKDIPVFNHTAHKKMWDMIADRLRTYGPDEPVSVSQVKYDVCSELSEGNHIPLACFACEYDTKTEGDCKGCPLMWETVSDIPQCVGDKDEGLYDLFLEAETLEQAAVYAEKIRDISVKEGIPCK